MGTNPPNQQADHNAKDWSPFQVDIDRRLCSFCSFGLGGRFPLEQFMACDEHAQDGANDRIGGNQRLVQQEDQRK